MNVNPDDDGYEVWSRGQEAKRQKEHQSQRPSSMKTLEDVKKLLKEWATERSSRQTRDRIDVLCHMMEIIVDTMQARNDPDRVTQVFRGALDKPGVVSSPPEVGPVVTVFTDDDLEIIARSLDGCFSTEREAALASALLVTRSTMATAKYFVTARIWNDDLKAQFGERSRTRLHELSADEIVAAIEKHGRASIEKVKSTNSEDDIRQLKFENDYD